MVKRFVSASVFNAANIRLCPIEMFDEGTQGIGVSVSDLLDFGVKIYPKVDILAGRTTQPW